MGTSNKTESEQLHRPLQITKLIYYEGYRYVRHARDREYYIKGKTRQWKIDLINTKNNDWNDLSEKFH
jgi:predicted GIY-YIG superfamily endonuclease